MVREDIGLNSNKEVLREIARLRVGLSSLSLQVTKTHASISRLEDAVIREELSAVDSLHMGSPISEPEFVVGSRVLILSRNNESWKTAQFVGRHAEIARTTPKCVWLLIRGRPDLLRRNKEFVELIN